MHVKETMMAEQDRLSNLPDDVIHLILSFLDMKFVVQTSVLSRKWKNIWTKTSHISLDSGLFPTLKKFSESAKHILSHRDNSSLVSSVELVYTGAVKKPVVKSIVEYAYACSTSQVTIKLFPKKPDVDIPQYFFISKTLKHLSLSLNDRHSCCYIENSDWDLPSLETLNLTNIRILNAFGKIVNLFAKCVMLKDLTLSWMGLQGLDIFAICAPQLRNLRIKDPHGFPKVLNVASPQLTNLMASVNAPTKETSCFDFLKLSTDGFNCLQNVNLSMSFYCPGYEEKRHVPGLLRLFKQLHKTKCLILDKNIVKVLSSSMDVCSSEPCPFDDLKCLKIDGVTLEPNDHKDVTTMATEVRKYLLENSQSATFIMGLPRQVSVKRSLELVDNNKKSRELVENDEKAKKVKLESKSKKKLR